MADEKEKPKQEKKVRVKSEYSQHFDLPYPDGTIRRLEPHEVFEISESHYRGPLLDGVRTKIVEV